MLFKYKEDYIYFLVLVILALLPMLNSTIPFIISMLVVVLFFCIPLSKYLVYKPLENLLYHIISLLHEYGIVSFVFHFFNYFFSEKLPYAVFKRRIIILNVFVFIQCVISRYYFIYKTLNIFLFIFLFLGFIAVYMRFCISFYIFINNTVRYFENDLANDVPKNKLFLGLFNYHKHTHNHPPFPPDKISVHVKVGVAVSLGALLVGCLGLYQQQLHINEARIANENARVANEHNAAQLLEFQKQNDLEALSQGLTTKNHVCSKYKDFCDLQQLAETMEASKKAGMPGIKSSIK